VSSKRTAAPRIAAAIALAVVALPGAVVVVRASPFANAQGATAREAKMHEGAHDFDFDLGAWHTHSRRLLHPLTGSKDWIELDGTTIVNKVWGGRANLAEYAADGPSGHLELLALRWYNPAAHQWYLNFATPQVGSFGVPGVGEFTNGRGEFYDQETIDGRSILVRFSIWGITPDSAQSEQAFSDDGGKSWEVNWINYYKRLASTAGPAR
jgi:hypothetical protein